jgi:hypothetical protein
VARKAILVQLAGTILIAMGLSACGGSATSATTAVHNLVAGLPASSHAKPVQTQVASCTPDGGFYIDDTKVSYYYTREVSLANVLPLLASGEAKDARSLAGLGPLLEVIALATNPGAATCGVGLTQTVLESAKAYGGTAKLDPPGVLTSVQRSYYDPIRPILVLSNNRLSICSADVNPGASVWLIAIFPPVNTKIPVAVVNPTPLAGFYPRIGKGSLPAEPPSSLYSEDVNHCIEILSANGS